MGTKAEPGYGPAKTGEQMRSVLDGSRLRKDASLQTPVPIEKGLMRTIDWFRAQS